jgi:hypothetical protein
MEICIAGKRPRLTMDSHGNIAGAHPSHAKMAAYLLAYSKLPVTYFLVALHFISMYSGRTKFHLPNLQGLVPS